MHERELLCHTSDFQKDKAEGYRYCSLSVSVSFLNSNTLKKKKWEKWTKVKISLWRLMKIVRLDGLFGNHYFL